MSRGQANSSICVTLGRKCQEIPPTGPGVGQATHRGMYVCTASRGLHRMADLDLELNDEEIP